MSHSPINISIYSKPDCPLCDEMTALVSRVKGKETWIIEHINIESDPELEAEYKEQIPVMFINGRKAFKAHVSEGALKKKIMKAKELNQDESGLPEPFLSSEGTYVPPRVVLFPFLSVVVLSFVFFLYEGVLTSQTGLRDLTAQLLRVESRDTSPLQFDLEKMTGGTLKVSELRDKVVFLNFWATWCPPCVEEMPSIRRLNEKLEGDKNFKMLLVSADESWEPVRKFFGAEGAPFTVLLDPEGEIAKKYGTTRFPETYVIIDGQIKAFIEGPRDWDTWFSEAYLKSFLSQE